MVRTSLCFKGWLQRYKTVNDSFVVRMAMKPSEVEVLTELCGRHRRRNNCQSIFHGRFWTRGAAPDRICVTFNRASRPSDLALLALHRLLAHFRLVKVRIAHLIQ